MPTANTIDIAELNRRYKESESCDSDLFAEQRSNVLLVSGDHYNRKGSRFWNRIRDNKQLSSEQKIRLTKNHIQKITKTYVNNITSFAPGVMAVPKNESENQDRKAAELNQAVIADLKDRQKVRKKQRQWAKDFIDIGECFVKLSFDRMTGDFRGFEAEVDEAGMVVMDEMTGQMKPSSRPVFTGAIQFERIFGFNVLRAPSAKCMDESPYLIVRKMVPMKDLKILVGDDEDKLKMIQESSDDTFMVFDGSQGEYTKSKDDALVHEHYIRPCAAYPMGYYFIATMSGILFEGELPFGIFPIKYVGFDEVPTTPRCRSIIKVLRPYQAEVNRAASKIAEHQITLGDDKLVTTGGSKVTHGGSLPGVRMLSVTGAPPVILPGRSGEQYLNYLNSQIQEMYQVSNVFEDSEEIKANLEPFSLLWRSIRHKKKFSMYAEKFEDFLVDVWETALELAKNYYDENHLIPAIGKKEYINISEFKSQDKLCYQIKIEPRTEDMETMMGKQIQMNHILQYVGPQMKPEDVGRMIKSLPFMDGEEAFGDLTIDYENAQNDILALDRGEFPPTGQFDNHTYMVKRLTHRMKQSDYRLLPPEVQANYDRKLNEHESMEAFNQEKIMHAKSGYVPTGGYMVVCDIYVPDPADPAKTKRARVPYEALNWLIMRLEEQGTAIAQLDGLPSGALSGIADKIQLPGPESMGTETQSFGGQTRPPNQPRGFLNG